VAGAGNINVFDPSTGAYLGQLDQADGTPIAITGLWELDFGDGKPHGGKTNQLYFDAGPNAPGVSVNGLFGAIQPAGDQGGNGDPARDRLN
jgi:prepilin-type processing-associated H-X9-DG protein